jgi:hypothetical protein
MAIGGKGRRKIVVGGRAYLWWVCDADPEYNSASTSALTVVSADGRFGVRFFLGQPADRRFVIVLGPEFEGLPDAGGPWVRVRCPEWQAGTDVTPAAVRRLIEWCTCSDRVLVRVNYLGYRGRRPESNKPAEQVPHRTAGSQPLATGGLLARRGAT